MGNPGRAGGGGGAGVTAASITELADSLPAGTFESTENRPPSDTYAAARAVVTAMKNNPESTARFEISPRQGVGALGGRGMDVFDRGSPVIFVGPRDGSRYADITNRSKPMAGRVGIVSTPTGRNGTGDNSALIRFPGSKRSVRVSPGQYQIFGVPRPIFGENPVGRKEK